MLLLSGICGVTALAGYFARRAQQLGPWFVALAFAVSCIWR